MEKASTKLINGDLPDFEKERQEAEERFPLIKQFRGQVNIAPTKVRNKGGQGEFVEADSPDNPLPGKPTITIGQNSSKNQGGIADTIINDMVHAAADLHPEFQRLKKELVGNLSERELAFAKKKYESKYKGKFSGSNFSTFDNFLNSFWSEGMVQHLLIPENSEIKQIKQGNPKAVPTLDKIERLFKTGKSGSNIGKIMGE